MEVLEISAMSSCGSDVRDILEFARAEDHVEKVGVCAVKTGNRRHSDGLPQAAIIIHIGVV